MASYSFSELALQDIRVVLSQTYPTTTLPEKVEFANAIVQQIDANPALSSRVLSAIKQHP